MPYVGRTPSAVPVTADDIPANSIDASKIVDGSIELAEIADNSITDTKLNSSKLDGIEAGATADQSKADIEGLGIDLPAANLTGTIADARFPSTLPAVSGANLTGIETVTKATTAPTTPAAGDMWFNTSGSTVDGISSKCMASYSGTEWLQMSNKFSATGGTESTYSSGGISYKVHTFTSSGTFTADAAGSVDVLVVAGGGGGSGAFAGGGGAGGIVYATGYNINTNSFLVSVGSGGGGGLGWQNATNMQGNTGGDSSVFGLIAKGGGGGSGFYGGTYGASTLNVNYAIPGGCGGGGGSAHSDMPSWLKGVSNQGTFAGATSYGNDGGNGHQVNGIYHGGGGGGAGAVGGAGSSSIAGNGGNGQAFTIRTGSSITYAGGGGAGSQNTDFGTGGTGGGGAGSLTNSPIGASGGINLGGGGGGGGYSTADSSNRHGGNGGSGIVIVRYAV